MKFGQNFCLDEISDCFENGSWVKNEVTRSRMILKMGHVGSKTGSGGQILEKLCVHSRGHI